MKNLIQENRRELFRLFEKIEVSTEGNRKIAFAEGVEQAVRIIQGLSISGGKLIWIGNGGSAAMASHMATDFLKNVGIPAVSFNDASLLTCISNDLGYEQVFSKPLDLLAQPEDILVAISSSGASRNIINAVELAKKKGIKVITLSGFETSNPLRKLGDVNFYVPSNHYGHVEDIHHSICHCFIDMLMQTKETSKERKAFR